jgi:hypothetical protein
MISVQEPPSAAAAAASAEFPTGVSLVEKEGDDANLRWLFGGGEARIRRESGVAWRGVLSGAIVISNN